MWGGAHGKSVGGSELSRRVLGGERFSISPFSSWPAAAHAPPTPAEGTLGPWEAGGAHTHGCPAGEASEGHCKELSHPAGEQVCAARRLSRVESPGRGPVPTGRSSADSPCARSLLHVSKITSTRCSVTFAKTVFCSTRLKNSFNCGKMYVT